jgi:hypothetical protein
MWEYRHMILEKSIDISVWDVYIVCKSNLVLKPTDLPYAHLFRAVSIPLDDKSMRAAALVGLNSKDPPKIKIHKFREIDWLYLCNNIRSGNQVEKIQGCVFSEGASERLSKTSYFLINWETPRKLTFSQLFATVWPGGTECHVSFCKLFKKLSFYNKSVFYHLLTWKDAIYLFERS